MDHGSMDRLYFGTKGKKSAKTQEATGVKNRAFVENQSAEGTLVKIGHFGEKMGFLGQMSV